MAVLLKWRGKRDVLILLLMLSRKHNPQFVRDTTRRRTMEKPEIIDESAIRVELIDTTNWSHIIRPDT